MVDRVINDATVRITQKYGVGHSGVDLGWRTDESENMVFAQSDGVIKTIVDGMDRDFGSTGMLSYGNYILIDHGNGYLSRYAHLKKGTIKVSLNQNVTKDNPMAVMGDSGNTTARHLHFEVQKQGAIIDPTPYLSIDFPKENTKITYQSRDAKYGWNPNVVVGKFDSGINSYAGNFGISMDAIYLDKYQIRVHDMIKKTWLPWVLNRQDYAGNIGHPIDGVQIYGVEYRAHLKDGNWLSWINTVSDTERGYAGIYGKAIDAIEIRPF